MLPRSSDPPPGWKPSRAVLDNMLSGLGTPSPSPPASPPEMDRLPEWVMEQRIDAHRKRLTKARRAYVTLLARGSGSYVSPLYARRPEVPDYVATSLPLLCSFRRVRSAYKLVILVANLTAAEVGILRDVGGDAIADIIDISHYEHGRPTRRHSASAAAVTPPAAAAPTSTVYSTMERRPPASCLMKGLKGSWMVHGRSDFDSTMLKTAVWRELAGRYEQVAFIDADTILLRRPDELFMALDPHVRRGVRACSYPNYCPHGVSWGKSAQWWQWPPSTSKSGCGLGYPSMARRRALCDELTFVAPESSRERTAERWNSSRRECLRPGWQSGFFFTRPSVEVAEALASRALSGDFSLFTQTEQDVIDAQYAPLHARISNLCTGSARLL